MVSHVSRSWDRNGVKGEGLNEPFNLIIIHGGRHIKVIEIPLVLVVGAPIEAHHARHPAQLRAIKLGLDRIHHLWEREELCLECLIAGNYWFIGGVFHLNVYLFQLCLAHARGRRLPEFAAQGYLEGCLIA